MKLLHHEFPTIDGFTVLGHTIWHSWPMIGVMFVTGVPSILLAHALTPVAQLLSDKPLHACAEVNRAKWLTNGAGMIGLGLVAGASGEEIRWPHS